MTAQYILILVASKMPLRFHTFHTRFCMSGIHLVIHDDKLREYAAEVSELFYHFQSLSLDRDVGHNVWFTRCWLVYHLSFLC